MKSQSEIAVITISSRVLQAKITEEFPLPDISCF